MAVNHWVEVRILMGERSFIIRRIIMKPRKDDLIGALILAVVGTIVLFATDALPGWIFMVILLGMVGITAGILSHRNKSE